VNFASLFVASLKFTPLSPPFDNEVPKNYFIDFEYSSRLGRFSGKNPSLSKSTASLS
jgi:hypothetical protein